MAVSTKKNVVKRKRPVNKWVRSGEMTFQEFCELIPDGQKGDLIDGVIYVASPDSLGNAHLQVWLMRVLADFCDIYHLGEIFGSRVAYKLDNKNSPEPDISFISVNRPVDMSHGRVEGAPDLAIEVVSPDSAHRDYEVKKDLYERAGVKEYWIIDQAEKKATFFVRKGKHFVEVKPQQHLWHSTILNGLVLDIRWFWSATRPRPFEVLREHYYPETT